MARIRLLHWKEEERGPRVAVLEKLGYLVDARDLAGVSMKEFRADPPDVLVIDLGRLPSRGLEVGSFLRGSKSTRLIPLVFVDGEAEKVRKVMEKLPDARFTVWGKIGPVLEDVLAGGPLREAVVPAAAPSASLEKKLGVKGAARLVNAPEGFGRLLPGVAFGETGLTLWFVGSLGEYRAALEGIRERAEDGGVWVIWPKTRPGCKPDINGNLVREMGLAVGLVDFKICSVDEVWSGMRFAVRK